MLSGSEYQKRYNKQKNLFGQRKKIYKQPQVTNSLTKSIKDYVYLTGGAVWRVNVSPIIKTNYIKLNGTTMEVVSGRIPAPNKGMSDLIAIKNGRFIGIEVKSPEDDLSDFQKLFKSNVLKSNGFYIVVRSFVEFKAAWDEIGKENVN